MCFSVLAHSVQSSERSALIYQLLCIQYVSKYHGNLFIRHTQDDVSHLIAHVCLWRKVSPEMGWEQQDIHCGQAGGASGRTTLPSHPGSSLFFLPSSSPSCRLRNKKCLPVVLDSWQGKAGFREKRETGDIYPCARICSLLGVTAGRQQTVEIRGHCKIYLPFLPFCATFSTLVPANYKSFHQNWTAASSMVTHGCRITVGSN